MFRNAAIVLNRRTASALLHNRRAGAAAQVGRTSKRSIGMADTPSSRLKEGEVRTAQHAWEKSCYFNMDYQISGSETVYDAIKRMAAYNVGCLIVMDEGKMAGIISERDYVCKVALLGRNSKETLVKDVCTTTRSMVVAKRSDSIETCVKKMISADIRHLPVIDDDSGEIFGLISVKDVVKTYTKEKDDILTKLFGKTLAHM